MSLKIRRLLLFFLCLLASAPLPPHVFAKEASFLAEDYAVKAQADYQNGYFQKAADNFQKALTRYHPEKEFAQYLTNLIRLVNCYLETGMHDQAETLLENFLPAISKSSDHYRNALFYNALADGYLSLDKTKEAAAALEKGAREAHLSQDTLVQATVLNTVGALFIAGRRFDKAAAAFDKALKLTDARHHRHVLHFRILMNKIRAGIDENKRNHREILSDITRLSDKLKTLKDSYEKAALFISLGGLCLDMMKKQQASDPKELRTAAFSAFENAATIGMQLNTPNILSSAFGCMGSLYESDARYDEALHLTRQAVFYAQSGDSAGSLYRWQWQTGRIFAALNNIESAVRSYQQAASLLTPICRQAAKGYRGRRNRFEEDIRPVYSGLAKLLIQQAQTADHPDIRQMKLVEARNTMEILKTAELQNFFKDECVTERQNEISNPTRNTDPGIVVIYPILFPDNPVMLTDFHDGIRLTSVQAATGDLTTVVRRLRENIQEWNDITRIYDDSNQLYNWLIRPLEPELSRRQIRTLITAPDGALGLLPFSVLMNNNRFLIEQYAVATIPAWSLTQTDRSDVKTHSVLAAGLSEEKTDSGLEFPPLANVPSELADIGKLFGGKQLLNKDFTVSKLKDAYQQRHYSIIHMATHGVFGGSSDASFILTYDGRLTIDSLEGLIDIGRYRKQQVELLTLSGCQTAVGDERAAFGLAGVAVKAGVRSALATLWSVDDNASFQIITEFYRQIGQGESKVSALQTAQKKMIQEPRYWHPALWSAFLLIGSWE